MKHAQMKNGPHLEMWAIGIAAGLVAGAVIYVVGQYGFLASAFVGALVAVVVGVVFGMPPARVEARSIPARQDQVAPAMAQTAPVAPAMAAFVEMPAPVTVAAPPVTAPSVTAPPAMMATDMSAADVSTGEGTMPATLSAPRGGKADDLKLVWGIGPKIEKLLHRLGFFHFDQLVNLTASELQWIDANLESFKGRASRDRWQVQAAVLVKGGTEQDAEDAMRRDMGEA